MKEKTFQLPSVPSVKFVLAFGCLLLHGEAWSAVGPATGMVASRALGEAYHYLYQVSLAQREWAATHVDRTEEILARCPEELRGWEWYYLRRLCHTESSRFAGHALGPWSVALSPDGRLAASTGWREVKVWEVATGQLRKTLEAGERGWVASVTFSPDGKSLCAPGFKGIMIWDTGTWEERLTIPAHELLIMCVAYSPDGKRVASCSGMKAGSDPLGAGEIKIWDATKGAQLLVIKETKWVNAVAFSPDGRWIASGSGELARLAPPEPGRLVIWDGTTGAEHLDLKGHDFWITSVAFSPDGRHLASGSADRTIKIWDLSNGNVVHTLEGHRGWVNSVAYAPGGARLASASDDGSVRLWDPNTGRELGLLRGHVGKVKAVAFSQDGKQLASASQRTVERDDGLPTTQGEVKIWTLNGGQTSEVLRAYNHPVTSVAFSPDGAQLASCDQGYGTADPGRVLVHELSGRRLRHVLPMEVLGADHVAFSRDGRTLVALATRGLAESQAWDAVTGKAVSSVPAAVFSRDGLLAASAGTVYEIATGKVACQLKGHILQDNVTGVAFSPDSKRVATANWGGYYAGGDGKETPSKAPEEVKVWDAHTGENLLTLPAAGHGVDWSLDGRYIASGASDGTVRIWDAKTGQLVYRLSRHTDGVSCVSFSPDSRRLVSGSADQTIKVWDMTTGLEAVTLTDHTGLVTCVAFSPDGHLIVSGSEDGNVRLWDGTP